MSVFTDLLGSIVKQVIGSTDAPVPAGTAPGGMAGKRMPSGETVDGLVPPTAGAYRRVRVNDRFGGARSGGIFGAYDVDGVEVRVLASLCPSAAAARARVRSARDGGEELGGVQVSGASVDTEPSWVTAPGSVLWSRGAYCYSASSHGTDGDVALPATPDQIAALDRFMSAFPF